jgi:hypothetical protein
VAEYWLTKLGSLVLASVRSRPVSRANPPFPVSPRAFSSSVTAVCAPWFSNASELFEWVGEDDADMLKLS